MWTPCIPYNVINGSQEDLREATKTEKELDPNLRSTHNVSGYAVQAIDGEIGHVEDFIIDDDTWKIRYLIIDTQNWWQGKKILISPQWINHISWDESKVFITLLSEAIKHSPEYTEMSAVNRDYETRLHQNYNRKGYWLNEDEIKNNHKVIINGDLLKEGMTNIQFITEKDIINVNKVIKIDKDKVSYMKILPFSSEEVSNEDGNEFYISMKTINEIRRNIDL